MKPILLIVAGANGSGKTTLINRHKKLLSNILFINPDDIAKQLDSSYDGKDNQLILKASRKAIILQNSMLQSKKSFGLETTLSGKRELKLIQKAKLSGYEVKLVYIGLNSYRHNILRVLSRVKKGGHYVTPSTIISRYKKSMLNLNNAIIYTDKTYIYDNSTQYHKQVGQIKENKWLILKAKDLPSWIKNIKFNDYIKK